MDKFRKVKSLILIAGIACWLSGISITQSFAHGVVVFAWIEGDTVHVESKFSGGRKAKGAKIVVQDMQGNKLLSGTTDEQGKFDFSLPGKEGLKIVLEAGMGHKGEWIISAAEIGAANSGSPSEPHRHLPAADADSISGKAASPPVDTQPAAAATDPAAIEAAVEKALDRKLAPLVQMLVDQGHRGPTFKDILGGIGFIIGLIGMAAYVHSRKKS